MFRSAHTRTFDPRTHCFLLHPLRPSVHPFVFCRMRSFARIRERIDDIRMSKPLLVGAVKLLLVTMVILNLLGGAWCVAAQVARTHARPVRDDVVCPRG